MKKKVPQHVVDRYTDILAHRYEPSGTRVACGTTMGKLYVLDRDEEKNDVNVLLNTSIPEDEPVLCLDWGWAGVVVGVKKGFYIYPRNDVNGAVGGKPLHVECMFDVMDVRMTREPGRIVAACDDGRLRVFDIETQKLVHTIVEGQQSSREVLSSNAKHIASGGQDGQVSVYDAEFRSIQPIWKFGVESKVVPGLALSEDSTWLATGSIGTPTIYNMRTKVALPPVTGGLNQRIYTIHFDSSGTLWWGGEGTAIYNTECLSKVDYTMRTEYGDEVIHHVFSIATSGMTQLSVAGSSNGILFTDSGKYWDTYVSL